jgi:tetrapyrrole methylase family protein/MazG family protein/ATP diphosphatase
VNEQRGASFPRLVEIMQRLLADDGCPWDREQDFESLRRFVLEEAAEVVDAIDRGDRDELREELGDLALQVVFLGELARREGHFGHDDVVAGICEKLVRRHPHVFGELEVGDSAEVLRNWERIKAAERAASSKKNHGVLGGVPRGLPALVRATRVGEKVARVGFDWSDPKGSRAKLDEELAELDAAVARGDRKQVEAELGDVLFALVNLSRHLGVDAESSLRGTIEKFTTRFAHVEQRVAEVHGGWPAPGEASPLALEELDAYWDEAKRRERSEAKPAQAEGGR